MKRSFFAHLLGLWSILLLFNSCEFDQNELTLKDEAVRAMVGLQALQYEDYRFWYYKIEKRAIIRRDSEAEATLLLLKAADKLIYWKESGRPIDSLLTLALWKTNDDSLRSAILLRKADNALSFHQFEQAERILTTFNFSLPAELQTEKAFLRFRADSRLQGIDLIDPVLDSLKNTSVSESVLLRFLTKAGDIAYNNGQFNLSSSYYKKALEISKKIGWLGFEAKLFVELADNYFTQNQLDSVGYFVDKANEILFQIPGPETACNGYYIAGRAQLRLGQLGIARNNFVKLWQAGSKVQNPRHLLKACLGISEVELKAKHLKEADSVINKGISFIKAADDEVLTHQAYFLAAQISTQSGQLERAISFINIGEKIERESQDTAELMVTIDEKLGLLQRLGRLNEMLPYFIEQERLLISYPNQELELSLLSLKANWLANLGRFKEANYALNNYDKVYKKYSIIDDTEIKRINELQSYLLRQEKRLAEGEDYLENGKKTFLFLICIVIVIFVLIIVTFIYKSNTLKRKQYKVLLKEREIEKLKAIVESNLVEIQNVNNQFIHYKYLEFNLFDSWSDLPDRKGLSVIRFNLILYCHLKQSLNYLAKTLNQSIDIDQLPSHFITVKPIEYVSEWEFSWNALRTFHPCLIELHVSDSIQWVTDAEKVKVFIDILVRQFIVKSHDRKELFFRAIENGFILETSLLYAIDLKELIKNNVDSDFQSYTSSTVLQSQLSKNAINELKIDLNLQSIFEYNAEFATLKFLFKS